VAVSRKDRVFFGVNAVFMVLVFIAIAYPLLIIVSTSFSSPSAVAGGKVRLLPVDFSLAGYQAVFQYRDIWVGYANTAFYTATGTLLNTAMTVAAAYPLSRKDFKARNVIMVFFTFTMFFSGGMIPTYLVVGKLGLLNTRAAMILPTAMSVFNVIITRTFFQSNIPDELLESAKIDGCSDFKFIAYFVIPLSGAILAVNALFYAVGHWNAFYSAFLYLTDSRLMPLQIKLRTILIMNQIDMKMFASADPSLMNRKAELSQLIKYALIVVASLPVLCIYPFVQKFFVKGVMIGSIKG
jgi:multiple sugar transport system permease protein/putative aldouronate transport system permease protein